MTPLTEPFSERAAASVQPTRSTPDPAPGPRDLATWRPGDLADRIEPDSLSRPLQAAIVSALSFGLFALIPIVALLVAPGKLRIPAMGSSSLLALVALVALAAQLGGATVLPATLRVMLGGTLAMAVTALVERLYGVVTG